MPASRLILCLLSSTYVLGVGGATGSADAGDETDTPIQTVVLDGQGPIQVEEEIIEIFAERPDKPFERDTLVRLTGEELAARGATNLAEALALIPELEVREAGRGGQQIDIRGARKGAVKILVDGVSVSDPYYGNFDVSGIPVTDIVQIRVSTSPSSPIDGVGGPGGVVEVHTRDAIGARLVETRLTADSLPSAAIAATGRAHLARDVAARVSISALLGGRDFSMPATAGIDSLDEDRVAATGAARLEYRRGDRRAVLDVTLQHRRFIVPPGEDDMTEILLVDRDDALRVGVVADDRAGDWRLQARAYVQGASRDSRYFRDAPLDDGAAAHDEVLRALRAGAAVLGNRPLGKEWNVIVSAVLDTERADATDTRGASITETSGHVTVAELAAGSQVEHGRLRVEAAAGVALPLDLDAAPWPEAKVTATFTPVQDLTPPAVLQLVVARKGRTPSLRDRFRIDIGNPALGPEQVSFAEAHAILHPAARVELDLASFVRFSNGVIRLDRDSNMLENSGAMRTAGVDARLGLALSEAIRAGATWSFTEAFSEESGLDPLDFLPRHRAAGWLTVARSRFGGTAHVAYTGERIDRDLALPGYTVVDASAWARVGGGLTASLRADNLGDQRYELRAGGVRAPGRVFLLSLQGSWE